jgi:hypothetical protein
MGAKKGSDVDNDATATKGYMDSVAYALALKDERVWEYLKTHTQEEIADELMYELQDGSINEVLLKQQAIYELIATLIGEYRAACNKESMEKACWVMRLVLPAIQDATLQHFGWITLSQFAAAPFFARKAMMSRALPSALEYLDALATEAMTEADEQIQTHNSMFDETIREAINLRDMAEYEMKK